MRGTLLHRRTQHAHDARRRSSNIWNDLDQLREERRQSKPAPQTRKELLQEKLRAHALACCESTRFTAGMTILTLYALFGDDAKLCLADSTADAAFVYAAVVCIFCFFAEMLLQCLAYPVVLPGLLLLGRSSVHAIYSDGDTIGHGRSGHPRRRLGRPGSGDVEGGQGRSGGHEGHQDHSDRKIGEDIWGPRTRTWATRSWSRSLVGVQTAHVRRAAAWPIHSTSLSSVGSDARRRTSLSTATAWYGCCTAPCRPPLRCRVYHN